MPLEPIKNQPGEVNKPHKDLAAVVLSSKSAVGTQEKEVQQPNAAVKEASRRHAEETQQQLHQPSPHQSYHQAGQPQDGVGRKEREISRRRKEPPNSSDLQRPQLMSPRRSSSYAASSGARLPQSAVDVLQPAAELGQLRLAADLRSPERKPATNIDRASSKPSYSKGKTSPEVRRSKSSCRAGESAAEGYTREGRTARAGHSDGRTATQSSPPQGRTPSRLSPSEGRPGSRLGPSDGRPGPRLSPSDGRPGSRLSQSSDGRPGSRLSPSSDGRPGSRLGPSEGRAGGRYGQPICGYPSGGAKLKAAAFGSWERWKHSEPVQSTSSHGSSFVESIKVTRKW